MPVGIPHSLFILFTSSTKFYGTCLLAWSSLGKSFARGVIFVNDPPRGMQRVIGISFIGLIGLLLFLREIAS